MDKAKAAQVRIVLATGAEKFAEFIFHKLNNFVKPDAIIMQDLGIIELIRQTNFTGELHLSTLANFTHPAPFNIVKKLAIENNINLDENIITVFF